MTTNIPVDELTATVTGTGGLVTGEIIEAGPALRVNFANNTLTGATLQTYTVQVKHGAQVMATLVVNVSGPDWEVVDGKIVMKNPITTRWIDVIDGVTICPSGSYQPRTLAEAQWYWKKLGGMEANILLFYIPGDDGYGNNYIEVRNAKDGVVWEGAKYLQVYDSSIDQDKATSSECLFAGEHIEYDTFIRDGATYAYGLLIRGTSGDVYTCKLKCVIWEP
jgi:hypothetical protein